MRRYWYRRILIMILVFTISVGGSWYLIEENRAGLEREASADASGELLIPGGMPVGIYLETKGAMVLGTEKIQGEDGQEYEPAANLVQEAADPNALIIFGATFDESMEDEICVTVIATGFDETIMNKKSGSAAPEKTGKAAGRSAAAESKASEEDDPYKEIFKIFNRER